MILEFLPEGRKSGLAAGKWMRDDAAVYSKYMKPLMENDLDFAIAVFRVGAQIDKRKIVVIMSAHTVE